MLRVCANICELSMQAQLLTLILVSDCITKAGEALCGETLQTKEVHFSTC